MIYSTLSREFQILKKKKKHRIELVIDVKQEQRSKCYLYNHLKVILNVNNSKLAQQESAMHLDPEQANFQQIQVQLIPNLHNLDPQVQSQVIHILKTIINPSCNMNIISEIARSGLLEEVPLLRSHIWKILLGVIDIKFDKWAESRLRNQQLYLALKQKYCHEKVSNEMIKSQISSSFFDRQLWNQIALDTKRTHSTLNFFNTEISFTQVFSDRPTKHSDILSRILYVWSKTNQSIRYVQGMNQILAPFYYLQFQYMEVLHWDRESEIFVMFTQLMGYLIDMHIKQMDDCQTGIMGRMIFLNRFLKVVDIELWIKMQKQKIYPAYYSFRWLALLFAQQFQLSDTMRLWDWILSFGEDSRFFFVYCIAIAILQKLRKPILKNDYMVSLPMIQKLKDSIMDADLVVEKAYELFQSYKIVNINLKYQMLAEEQKQESSKSKVEQIHMKPGKWSYADLIRGTSNFISKIVSPKKNKNWT